MQNFDPLNTERENMSDSLESGSFVRPESSLASGRGKRYIVIHVDFKLPLFAPPENCWTIERNHPCIVIFLLPFTWVVARGFEFYSNTC